LIDLLFVFLARGRGKEEAAGGEQAKAGREAAARKGD